MKIYLVGGAVRDQLLGIEYHEKDWVVTGSSREEMLAAGFLPVQGSFPVFLHPHTGDEYALARRETKVASGYQGFTVDAAADVTLEEDLKRRDLTINAMARDEAGSVIDPYHGQEDLDAGVLRHVSPAFSEDPVRLLRIARFAAKLGCWGFRVAHGTHALLKKMAASEDLLALRRERIWKEMRRALMDKQPWRFVEVLHTCGALQKLLPDLHASLGDARGHAGKYCHGGLLALRRATQNNAELDVRYAALMLSVTESGLPVDRACSELLALAQRLRDSYLQLPGGSAAQLLEFIQQAGKAGQHRLTALLAVYGYTWPEEAAVRRTAVLSLQSAVKSVTAEELMRKGLQGAALGQALHDKKIEAIEQLLG